MISFRKNDYMYSYNKMKPKMFSTHLHKYYEFLYFNSGDGTYIVEGNEYKAEDGDLFITVPGELHSIVFKSDREYEREFIQISEELLKGESYDFLKLLRKKPLGEGNKISHERLDAGEVKRCFQGVKDCVSKNGEDCDALAKSYIVQLLHRINTLLEEKESTIADRENERIRAAKKYINENLCKSISLEKVAEATFTDKYYLSHLFKKETGMTVKDYVSMQRIALAKKLMDEGWGASEVYSECGFGDYSSFYRAFKRLSGKSPGEFFKRI